MGEPITTGAMIALAMGLVKVVEKLVEVIGKKMVPEKEDAGTSRLEQRIDAFAEHMAAIASSLERSNETLDRIEARLEKVSDAATETRLQVMSSGGRLGRDR